MRRVLVVGALVTVGTWSVVAAGRQQPAAGPAAPRVVEIEKLEDNYYVMKGGGGNSSVFITAGGVVVVDTKNPGWGQPLLDAIKTVTDKPVTTIVNTHTHGDHVSGNVEFPATVDVVTHENTAANMKVMRPNSSAPPSATPPPNIFTDNGGKNLAKRTFTDRLTIGSGADRIELHHFGRAHTNGDALVYFPAHRIAHIADMFPGTELPIMDGNNGGSATAYADTLTKVLAFTEKNADLLVNGHRNVQSSNADLKAFIAFVRGYVSDAQAAKKAGKTPDEFASTWKPAAPFTAQPPRVIGDARVVFDETK